MCCGKHLPSQQIILKKLNENKIINRNSCTNCKRIKKVLRFIQ